MNKSILVTGGSGYIGSHCVLELHKKGYKVIIIDNLSNSKLNVLDGINKILGPNNIEFFEIDLCNMLALQELFSKHKIDSVIHFAANKSIPESIINPMRFYQNNILGSLNLLQVMKENQINNIIFSSSATVYDEKNTMPLDEKSSIINPLNPYGKSKLFIEEVIRDIAYSNEEFNAGILRYFNPLGAHSSGLIGEDPILPPDNLGPALLKAINSEKKEFNIYGNDYETSDGTCVRDYIHIMDLARGHVSALESKNKEQNFNIWNLGSGKGYSVLEVIKCFEEVADIEIKINYCPRRNGDIPISFASNTKALNELGWTTKRDLHQMLNDLIKWDGNN
tara:strand:- start:1491 stop:2498 length:1008 start_codon:yes stop_codon:yes gene_type:complete